MNSSPTQKKRERKKTEGGQFPCNPKKKKRKKTLVPTVHPSSAYMLK